MTESKRTSNLAGKNIILGISGGIAAYKSVYLLRGLKKRGANVQVVITPNGKEFITPVTLSSLSGNPVISEFFTANSGEWHSHVDLGLWADAMLIAPATASTLGKMAHGIADNMLITTYLSSRAPVIVAPAMDMDMWAHQSTKRNIEILRGDGVEFIMPTEGELASHLIGKGRMREPEEIISYLEEHFENREEGSLKGKKILITSGPTYESIDPVRFIGNYSSGKMGYALAEECLLQGAREVVMVTGPTSIRDYPGGLRVEKVTTAIEMLEKCEEHFGDTDVAILCAAVSDYRVAEPSEKKIKREQKERLTLELIANPDIAATLGSKKMEGQLLVGFALETDNAEANAANKMRRKGLDWIVLNSMEDAEAGFGKDTNKVTILGRGGEKHSFSAKPKRAVAADIISTITNENI